MMFFTRWQIKQCKICEFHILPIELIFFTLTSNACRWTSNLKKVFVNFRFFVLRTMSKNRLDQNLWIQNFSSSVNFKNIQPLLQVKRHLRIYKSTQDQNSIHRVILKVTKTELPPKFGFTDLAVKWFSNYTNCSLTKLYINICIVLFFEYWWYSVVISVLRKFLSGPLSVHLCFLLAEGNFTSDFSLNPMLGIVFSVHCCGIFFVFTHLFSVLDAYICPLFNFVLPLESSAFNTFK